MRLLAASATLLGSTHVHMLPRMGLPPQMLSDTNFTQLEPIEPKSSSLEPTPSASDLLATTLRVPPTVTDVVLGSIVFLLLHSILLSTAAFVAAGAADVPAGKGAIENLGVGALCRAAATVGFVAVQNAAGTLPDGWLAGPADASSAADDGDRWWLRDESAILRTPSPEILSKPLVAAPLVAIGFAAAVAALGAATGVDLLPEPRPLPSPGRVLDVLIAAPVTEELFFRAWLLRMLERAGASLPATLAISSALFALWHVPVIAAGNAAPGELVFFATLSAVLSVLYQRSAGSLPLVAGTHASFNAIVVALRTARYYL